MIENGERRKICKIDFCEDCTRILWELYGNFTGALRGGDGTETGTSHVFGVRVHKTQNTAVIER